jgi:hypothetical protein
VKGIVASIAFCISIATSSVFAANLIVDGSFENAAVNTGAGYSSGAITGSPSWTVSSGGAQSGVLIEVPSVSSSYPAPKDPLTVGSPDLGGNQIAYFTTDTGTVTVSQTLTLLAGTHYHVGYDLIQLFAGQANPASATMTVVINGVTLGSTNTSQLPAGSSSTDASAWKNFSFAFTPTTTSNTISFTFSTGGGTAKDIGLDRVFTEVVTPESPSLFVTLFFVASIAGIETLRHRDRNAR